MITISKIEHRGKVQILLQFYYCSVTISKIKNHCQAKYTNTHKGWCIEYNKEIWSIFKNLGLEYKIENSRTTGCAKPLSVHTGEKIADVPLTCTEKAADTKCLTIKYFHPYFYVKGLFDEQMIHDLKLLPKTYWNVRYRNWVVQANHEAMELFYHKWKCFDEHQYIVWNQQIDLVSNPPICVLYSSPQYPEQVLIQLKGKGVDVDFVKHLTQRLYNAQEKFWSVPYDEKIIGRVIDHYTSIKTKVINRLKSGHKLTEQPSLGQRRAYLLHKIPDNFKTVMASYIDTLVKERYSWKTITSYSRSFLRYMQTIAPSPCHSKTEMDVNKYLCEIAESKVSDSVINTHINAIKFYYQKVEFQPHFMIEKIKRPRPSQLLPKVLSIQEVDRMLRSVQNIKHVCLLSCIYGHGLRLGEVRNIKMEDVKWDRNQIFISKGKGKKDRYVNLSQDFKLILQLYVHEYKPIHYLFEGQDRLNQYSERSIQEVVKKAAKLAGIQQKVSTHTLRHCFATHLLDIGTQLPYIKELLGHANIKTTMIYTHITTASLDKVESPLDKLGIFTNQNLEKPH